MERNFMSFPWVRWWKSYLASVPWSLHLQSTSQGRALWEYLPVEKLKSKWTTTLANIIISVFEQSEKYLYRKHTLGFWSELIYTLISVHSHRMVGVGKDLWRSPGPTPAKAGTLRADRPGPHPNGDSSVQLTGVRIFCLPFDTVCLPTEWCMFFIEIYVSHWKK